MYVLNANHISKSYKTAGETMRILQNVNLQVMKGEMVVYIILNIDNDQCEVSI